MQRACKYVWGTRKGGSFLRFNFQINESILSNMQPDHNLGNCFKIYATPLELADGELMSKVGCYDAGSDKSSNKDYNNHSDCDSNNNSKGNVCADPARNNILRRKRKECMLPRYLVCEHYGEEAGIAKDENGGTN